MLLANVFVSVRVFADKVASDDGMYARLNGRWRCVTSLVNGDPVVEQFSFSFDRNTISYSDSSSGHINGDFRLLKKDESKYLFSVVYTNEMNKWEGIVKVENNLLYICFSDPGAPAPVDFTSKPGSKQTLYVLKPDTK